MNIKTVFHLNTLTALEKSTVCFTYPFVSPSKCNGSQLLVYCSIPWFVLFLFTVLFFLLQLDLESGTQQSLYGLHTDKEYEVRVRCKMLAFDNFGEFSDSIFVHVAQIPSKG